MLTPETGSIVLWWEDDALRCGTIVGEEKQRVVVVSAAGREERIASARIATVVARGTPPGRDAESVKRAGDAAGAMDARLRARSADVDIPTLWDLVHERDEPIGEQALAEIALEAGGELERAAVLLALRADGLHFIRKPSGWMPRSAAQVSELLAARKSEARKAAEREAVFAALAGHGRGEAFAASGSETEARVLSAVEALAVSDQEAPDRDRSLALAALEAAAVDGDRPAEKAFRLLRWTGRFAAEDENLAIVRYGLRTEFPGEVLAAAESAAAAGFDRARRRDLTDREALTIDASWTTEVDDALSIAPRSGGGFEVGIHIADPGAYVPVGHVVDVEAGLRGTTYYFPDRKLLMLPSSLAEGVASLTEGQDRPALSFLVTVDAEGRVVAHEIVRSVVRVASRLAYEAVDATLLSGAGAHAETLALFQRCALAREGARRASGALSLRAEEAEIRVAPDGSLSLTRRNQDAPAQRLVSEAMVLAGEVAAAWLLARGAPAIYRRQAPPDGRRGAVDPGLPEVVRVRAIRRALKRGETGLTPAPHHGLGLEAYVQVTSPIRRYQDLVLHRQIAALLETGAAAYDAAEMQAILATTERAEMDGRRAERSAVRYWMLKWLARSLGGTVTGTVVEVAPRIVVTLDETLLDEPVPALAGAALGDRVRLRVERVNPRADLVVLRPD